VIVSGSSSPLFERMERSAGSGWSQPRPLRDPDPPRLPRPADIP